MVFHLETVALAASDAAAVDAAAAAAAAASQGCHGNLSSRGAQRMGDVRLGCCGRTGVYPLAGLQSLS